VAIASAMAGWGAAAGPKRKFPRGRGFPNGEFVTNSFGIVEFMLDHVKHVH
jgi:hypothetical protein